MATIASTQAGAAEETHERWIGTDGWNLTSFTLGLLLESYIFGMSSIATGWVAMPTALRSLLLSWSPLWLIIGIAVAGPLSDHVGRKTTFYITMSMYGLGVIGITFSNTYWLILLFLAVLLFAAGGEMNAIMAANHEVMPTKDRSKTMMLELNFGIGMGGLILGAVSLLTIEHGVAFQRGMLGATFVVALIVLFIARAHTPESIRWLRSQGRDQDAEREIERYYGKEQWQMRLNAATAASGSAMPKAASRQASIPLRLFVTTATAFTGTAGFGLLTYVLGPAHFPKLTADIIFVASIAGVVTGVFAFWADRLSRRWLLLVGYLGGFIMTLIIALLVNTWASAIVLFWILLVLYNAFGSIAYLTEDTLKAEVWPTRRRGTYTAAVRFVSIGLYIGTIYWTQNFSLNAFTAFVVGVAIIGLAGAVVWFFWGNETGQGVSIEMASGEAAS